MKQPTLETTRVRTERIAPAFVSSMLKSLAAMGLRAVWRASRNDSPDVTKEDRHMIDQPTTSPNGGRPAIEGQGARPMERNPIEHAKAFLEKFGKDWCMNLCSLLAYNFLGAMFPLLLGILAIGALFLPPSLLHQVGTGLNGAIPSAANGQGGLNLDFNSVLDNFRRASGPTAVISFLALLWTGSSLFGVMENSFSIIYRTKDRDFIWQKLMSIAMIIIFAILDAIGLRGLQCQRLLPAAQQGLW